MQTHWKWAVGLWLLAGNLACDDRPVAQSPAASTDTTLLVQTYCGGCHRQPAPTLLPRSIWAGHVLPTMGAMLGHYPVDRPRYQREALLGSPAEAAVLEAARIFPAQPTLSAADWQAIQRHYLDQAPAQLSDSAARSITEGLRLFRPRPARLQLSPPSSTLLAFGADGTLYLGDANSQRLYLLDAQGQVQQAARVREGAVHLQETPEALFVTVMGSFSPTDQPTGFVLRLPKVPGQPVRVVLDSLKRPVHSQLGDLNGDGLTDLLVCEYGKWTGQLNWYAQQPDGSFIRHTLRDQPGATRAYLRDLDGDGDLDLLALMAQGDEGIFRYDNDGQGHFTESVVLRFPPSYGSSYFALHDLDGDSLPDLVYTNGDNADYQPILKPYHGLRLYRNQGDWTFALLAFIPLHGAYKAIPADFDQDGDLDLAAISFFPDYAQGAREGFVYLENEGDFAYTARTFAGVGQGRWLTIDVGDPDGDGDLDLALGSLTFEVPGDSTWVNGWVRGQLPYLLLENQLR